jgi:hypothetical protein
VNRGLTADALDAALTRMAEALRSAGARDAGSLAAEAGAVLDAVVAAAQDGATEVDRNEALALGALLGRRLASAGASATVVLLLVEGIERERRAAVGPERALPQLLAVVIEGYAAGVRETTMADLEAKIAEQVEMIALGPGLVLVPLPFLEDVDRMASAIDALGRKLLARDVKACALWVQGPTVHREEASLAGIAAFVENARMVGAKVAIAAPDQPWQKRIAERLDGTVPVSSELGGALEALGYAVQKSSVLRRWLSG